MKTVQLDLDCGEKYCESCRMLTDGHQYCKLFNAYVGHEAAMRLDECKNAQISEA